MTNTVEETVRSPERMTDPVSIPKTKSSLKQIVVVSEVGHDVTWLGRLRSSGFEAIQLTSNFDAVQTLIKNLEVRLVLFTQRSTMMDGIAACQLLRQTRSEDDVAVVLMLNENLDHAVIEAFAAGASDVVCHPFHTGELIARLDATLQRLLLWEDDAAELVGFQTEQLVSTRGAECTPKRPHFGGPKRMNPSMSSPLSDATSASQQAEDDQPLASPEGITRKMAEMPQPEPQTRVATQLAGDWLQSHNLPRGLSAPALDLTQLKFVPSMPIHQIEAARQRGDLSEVLLDRVWVCPQCRALPSFRPACPCCGSAGVERDRMMHHYACAFVGPTSEFQWNDEGLSCPKCCAQRLMVGTDCEFLDGPWRCSDCDWSPAELEIVGHCLKCGFRFPAQQAALEDLVGICAAHPND